MNTQLFHLPNHGILTVSLALLWSSGLHADVVKFGGLPVVAGDVNTTWTCPAGVTSVKVECWGGGGAGGAAKASAAVSVGGGGGGGGCYSIKSVVPVTPGNSYTVFIPDRVVNSTYTDGFRVNGGDVSFTGDSGVTVTAKGGQGGESKVSATAVTGAGGVASISGCVGDLFYIGGNGGSSTTAGRGGMGGSAPSDLAAGANAVAVPPNNSTQSTGATGSDADHAGGNGAAGRTSAGAGNIGGTVGGGGGGAMVTTATQQPGQSAGKGQILLTYSVAGTNVKANNTDNLNLASSWTVGLPATTDVAKWNNTVLAANTTSLGADLTFAGISVENPGGLVTINAGNTLTLGAAATDIDLSSAGPAFTLNCNLTLGADHVWNVAASRTFTAGGIVSGANSITKQGAGTAVLSGNNTSYSGATTISAGALNIQHGNALGDTSNGTSVTNGATLQLQGGIITAAEVLTLASGTSTNPMLLNVSGDNTWSGTVDTSGGSATVRISSTAGTLTLANTITGASASTQVVLGGDGNVLVSGKITGVSPLTASNIGAGTRTLTAANDFIGTVSLNGGKLVLSGVGTSGVTSNNLTLNGGQLDLGSSSQTVGAVSITGAPAAGETISNGSLTGISYTASNTTGNAIISANLLANASAGFAKSGAGTVTLSGNNAFTGATIITAGRINIQHANALGGTAGDTTVSNGATLQLQGGLSYSAEALTLTSGASNNALLQNVSGDNTWNGTIGTTGSGTLARISSDAGLLTVANTLTGTDAATSLILQGDGDILVSGKITGSSGLISSSTGTGIRTLSNPANDFTGAVTLSGGTLALGAGNVLPSTAVSIGTATLDAATFADSVGTLDVTDSATINLGSGAALAFADSSAVDWTGGTLNLTGAFVSGASLRFGTTNTGLTGTQLALITATGFSSFALNASGYLTATAAGGYSAWQSANGTTQTINLDHDNDGVSNGVEYFLGGNTTTTGFTTLPGVTNTGGTLSVIWTKAASYTGIYGTDFVVETSSTLSDAWSSETLGVTVTITGNDVKYTFPAGIRNFARLKVTGP